MLNRRVLAYVDRQLWLNPVADLVGDLVHGAYRAMGTAAQPVRTSSTAPGWGTAAPSLTDFTLGAWMSSTVLDSLVLWETRSGSMKAPGALAAGIASTLHGDGRPDGLIHVGARPVGGHHMPH